jgi:RHS repeat-associated protein
VVEERTGSYKATYVWSPVYVDALVARNRDTDANGTLDERLYVLHDAMFNTTGIINTSGTVQERFKSDAFGNYIVLNASWAVTVDTKQWVYVPQGKRFDTVLRQYDSRHRIVSVDLMRALQPDPLGYPDGMNRYAWETNNPVNRRDSQGTSVEPSQIQDPSVIIDRVSLEVRPISALPFERMITLWRLGKNQFDPGVGGIGGNAFCYTCKYGFIDVGHFWFAAFAAYVDSFLAPVAWTTPLPTGVATFAQSSGIELTQALSIAKSKLMGSPINPWGDSAFTAEDLPSNAAGRELGYKMFRADLLEYAITSVGLGVLAGHVFEDDYFSQFLRDAGAVQPTGDIVRSMLRMEARSWRNLTTGLYTAPRFITSSGAIKWQCSRPLHAILCNGDSAKPAYAL